MVWVLQLKRYTVDYSLQNKCRTADPDRQNLGRSGKLSFFVIYKFWQNCPSVQQVSDLILKTGIILKFGTYIASDSVPTPRADEFLKVID